ncbi:MAG TPA: glucoamylase family protein [Longimicrobium sp.]|nr:glucoamylase family protein [Longimicrobium sp.]
MRRLTLAAPFALLLAACAASSTVSPPSPGAPAAPSAPSAGGRNDAFLDTLQRRTFGFFWDLQDPGTHLIPDRWPTRSFASVAAVGFGLAGYPVGVERGYVTRAQGAERTLATLRWLWATPQGSAAAGMTGYKGFFYHFLDMRTGRRFERVELSTIDSALLFGGVLVCREYFDGAGADEREIRALADSLYLRADWKWVTVRAPKVSMGWSPEEGFHSYDWNGMNEAMLLYVLALGSPTHPADSTAWSAWTSTYTWGTFQGQENVQFAPLFGHQYSQMFIDFRGIRDAYMRGRGIDYFENSRRATLSQRAYAIANPGGWAGYGPDVWGLTASDGPVDGTFTVNGRQRAFQTYTARGAALGEIKDDGTLAPTAAGGSIPFAPEVALSALKEMRRRYGDHLFRQYGFVDAFNPTLTDSTFRVQMGKIVPGVGWFDDDYLGIDQGPILLQAENYRSELIWRMMRKNPYVIRGLRRAGFTGGWLDGAPR